MEHLTQSVRNYTLVNTYLLMVKNGDPNGDTHSICQTRIPVDIEKIYRLFLRKNHLMYHHAVMKIVAQIRRDLGGVNFYGYLPLKNEIQREVQRVRNYMINDNFNQNNFVTKIVDSFWSKVFDQITYQDTKDILPKLFREILGFNILALINDYIIPTFNYKNIEKLLEHFNHSSVRLTDFFENDRDVKLIKIEDNLQKEEPLSKIGYFSFK